jgi:hypothetical protein
MRNLTKIPNDGAAQYDFVRRQKKANFWPEKEEEIVLARTQFCNFRSRNQNQRRFLEMRRDTCVPLITYFDPGETGARA